MPHLSFQSDNTTSDQLEALVDASIQCINTRDWRLESPAGRMLHPRISPNWHSTFDNIPDRLTWEQQWQMFRAMAEQDRDFRFEITSIETRFYGECGEIAVVLTFYDVMGVANVRMQAASEGTFRLIGGVWMYLWQTSMRGRWFE